MTEAIQVIDRFSGQWAMLSNFHPASVAFEGDLYPTVEHAFQAAKTTDKDERGLIMKAPTPTEAKRLGRAVDLRPDWEPLKIHVMRSLLMWKFTQARFARKLLDTGDAALVEGNFWHDQFWGVANGVGDNHLGKLLMEIRSGLRLVHFGQSVNKGSVW